ncbi:MAG: hypothetical protein PHO15_11075, partial [Eubacteriales bacterium]|nr:hypothetical protein [Eubacteriales bacterium]
EKIREMKAKLNTSLPKICAYFDNDDFNNISIELERYNKNVKKHYYQFLDAQLAWAKICESLR